MIINPARLSSRPRIGICAPSSAITPERLDQGCAVLSEQGAEVIIHPQTYTATGQVAGSDFVRANALQDLLLDDTLEAVFCAAGGHRAVEILPLLDWEKIAAVKPKIIMGFSDNSILINAITARLGWVSVFGPTVQYFSKLNVTDPASITATWELLRGKITTYDVAYAGQSAQGHIIACTLTLLPLLLDTPDILPLKNAILCIEDCNEELSTIDRHLLLLKRRGVFENIAALVCGSFTDLKDTGRPFGFDFKDIVRHHAGDTPVAFDAPFGHGDKLCALPISVKASLHKNELSLLEPAFI